MLYSDFIHSLNLSEPPAAISPHLLALWHDGRGEWVNAHAIVQDINDLLAARIHAYLHRAEGDIGNSEYWYRRAGISRPDISLKAEWEQMVRWILEAED